MNVTIVDCFDTWEHRVDLLLKILMEEGHSVKVLISNFCHITKLRRLEKKNNFKFFFAASYKKNISVKRIYSHIQISRDMFTWVEKHEKDIDMLWVLAPPNSFVKDAATIKRKHQHIKLIIDLIDLWPESMPLGLIKQLPMCYAWQMIRDRNLKYADMVVTECDLYRHVLGRRLSGIKSETLYLAREDKGYKPELNLPENKIALCYLGSINNIIDIATIEKLIKTISVQNPVLLHIIGDGERGAELVDGAKAAGADVVFHGLVYDRNEKKKIFDSCHYGLNIMKDLVCVGLTMKSIDYFEFGLPIINNIKGDTWTIIEKYKCGINFRGGIIELPLNVNYKERRSARLFFERYLAESVFKAKVKKIIVRINE